MKVKRIKGKVQIPAGYYRLDKRQLLREGDRMTSGADMIWDFTGRVGCLAVCGDLIYIRKLSKKQKRTYDIKPLDRVRWANGRIFVPTTWRKLQKTEKLQTGDMFPCGCFDPGDKGAWETTGQAGQLNPCHDENCDTLFYIRKITK